MQHHHGRSVSVATRGGVSGDSSSGGDEDEEDDEQDEEAALQALAAALPRMGPLPATGFGGGAMGEEDAVKPFRTYSTINASHFLH